MRKLERGATPLAAGRTSFSVWAPRAETVSVCLLRASTPEQRRLEGGGDGMFHGIVEGVECGDSYAYRLDDGPQRPDPVSRFLPEGVHGPTRVVDPGAFEWSDAGWRGLPMPDAIIYELHVGTFTPEGTFDSAVGRLEYLVDLGVTAIELMPVAQFPGARNWGYDGASLFAVQNSYGGPDGLRRFVNAAHRHGLAVLLDVVYNHGGPEGNYLSEFGPYWSDQARTSWGEGFNLDGPDSDEVRRYVVDNAVYWITEYHLDGLRLDAADRIVDFGALHILEELTNAVHQQGEELGRGTLVIAESDANDPRYVRPVSKGGYGIDAQWSDDFHHAVHAALTGERQGYFADFGEIESVAKAIQRRFVNDGRYSPSRRRRHGRVAEDVPGDRFVICVQNHDQIGNRAAGERLSMLVPPPARRLAAAVLLLSPYVPLLFMGEEFDEVAPFQYFVSHTDPELCRLVSEGRRREFAAFDWSGAVPDPSDEATFLRSKLDWGLTASPAHARMLALHRDLLRLRRTEPGLRPGAARPAARHDRAQGSVVVELESLDHRLVALYNFSDAPQTITVGDFGWEPMLSTESAHYGGSDGAVLEGAAATLPPFSALLLRTRPA